ncbi:MAG: D-glycero-beta-D-manno-heptose 1-phosphate adenylyltransferase [Oligoflexia bacterium]|nr:D-glycero-beta-D-manno-heptose 1-phosphate adenylyltransferase [Oligoflexia bacterium]
MFDLSVEAAKFLKEAREKEKKIVFTNGCFDIIHSGHVKYLNEAKELGDLLFVGLNANISVKKLKGFTRPINDQNDRKYVLENLKSVDFVEIFLDETPLELIKIVRPNILVKGGDWNIEKIVGGDFVISYGGEVRSLKFLEGYSSSVIISALQSEKMSPIC